MELSSTLLVPLVLLSAASFLRYRCDRALETPRSESHPACGDLHRSDLFRVSIRAVLTWYSETLAQVCLRYFLCQRFLGFTPGCCQNRSPQFSRVRPVTRVLWHRRRPRSCAPPTFAKSLLRRDRSCGGDRRVRFRPRRSGTLA